MGFSVKHCELVQQVEHLGMSIEEIQKILENKSAVTHWAYILHDKDLNKNGEMVKPHYHIYIKLSSSRNSEQIVKWFGWGHERLSKIKGNTKDILMYLTHENATDKHQYSEEEVFSNFDIAEEKQKQVENENINKKLEDLVEKISLGEIRRYNIHEFFSSAYEQALFMSKHKKVIEESFDIRDRIVKRSPVSVKKIYYITGSAGSGKSRYAKDFAKGLGKSFFESSTGKDPFDGYEGQEVVILDDLRADVFTLAELLKILDPYSKSTAKSRYKNKVLQCDTIIITSIKPLSDLYSSETLQGEPLEQLERRINMYMVFDGYKNVIHRFIYNKIIGDMERISDIENPYYKSKEEELKEKQYEYVSRLQQMVDDNIISSEEMNELLYKNINEV